MMTLYTTMKHLPLESIYVTHIDECCLHHDDEHNGDEKMVSGHLFYSDYTKSFYFFSVFVIPEKLPSYDYSEEHKLHIWKCAEDFNPLKPTFAQAYRVMESRFGADTAESDNMDCTLEDIWMINDKTQMYLDKVIPL